MSSVIREFAAIAIRDAAMPVIAPWSARWIGILPAIIVAVLHRVRRPCADQKAKRAHCCGGTDAAQKGTPVGDDPVRHQSPFPWSLATQPTRGSVKSTASPNS